MIEINGHLFWIACSLSRKAKGSADVYEMNCMFEQLQSQMMGWA